MTTLRIQRTAEREFIVVSGTHIYHITHDRHYQCSCPARGMCKHLQTALSCNGLAIGAELTIGANTDSSCDDGLDDGLLSPEEFDAEAGRDVLSELEYIRSGREKRNCGC